MQLVSWIFDSSFMSLTMVSFFSWEVGGMYHTPLAPLALVTLCWHSQADDTLQSLSCVSRCHCVGFQVAAPLPCLLRTPTR